MMEDTLPTLLGDANVNADKPRTSRLRNDLHLQFEEGKEGCAKRHSEAGEPYRRQGELGTLMRAAEVLRKEEHERNLQFVQEKKRFSASMPISRLAALLVVLLLPVQSFIRGVLACLMSFAIADSLSILAQALIYKFFQTHPEQSEFEIPDFTTMPICEVPAVEEILLKNTIYDVCLNMFCNRDDLRMLANPLGLIVFWMNIFL